MKKEENDMFELISQMIEMNKLEKERNERERAQLLEMMRKMSDQITGLEKKVESKIDEKFKKVEKEILIKVNEDIDQRFEKFKRRKNLVIYGLPEGVGKEEREKHRSDDESIKVLIKELNVEVERFKSIRLGNWESKLM